jgi:hypothetical protein
VSPSAKRKRLSERHAKILLAMYYRSSGTTTLLPYEDIVVEAFERFPEDFQLRGHPQYPDASDIHKPLYEKLSKDGYVSGANKQFKLTKLGLMTAETLLEHEQSFGGRKPQVRVDREDERELARLRATRAHDLYSQGRGGEVVDSDFYAFFKVSPRTKRHEFAGRLRVVEELLQRALGAGHDVDDLEHTREFLTERFRTEVLDPILGREQTHV